jgi:hypothetical protein
VSRPDFHRPYGRLVVRLPRGADWKTIDVPICIAGVPSSGISMVARILGDLGLDLAWPRARSRRIRSRARARVRSLCRGSAAGRSTRASPTLTRARRGHWRRPTWSVSSSAPCCSYRSSESPSARRELGGFATVALGGTAAYFVLHGPFEWLFLIAAVAVPAAVALGACAAAGGTREIRLAPGRQRTVVAVRALVVAVEAVPVNLSTTLTARAEDKRLRRHSARSERSRSQSA